MASAFSEEVTFKYEAVSHTMIRVFRMDTSVGSTTDTPGVIRGHLEYTLLDEAPPFLALSYCWGGMPKDMPLDCDGLRLYVTRTLADSILRLQRLCGPDIDGKVLPEFRTRYIWADQICINQDDPDERSQQVKLMGEIYSRAIRTVIWLGYDNTPTRNAWQMVDKLYQVFERESPGVSSGVGIPAQIYGEASHVKHGLPPWEDTAWNDLYALMSLPWFGRTWAIQEAVLSSLDPILIHGDVLYRFERLGWVASWLRRKGYLRHPRISTQFQNVDTVANIRRSRCRWTFDVLVMSTSAKFRATDQRDKIFGLLGMAEETHDPKRCPPELQADYNLDLAQVYQNVARYLFRKHQSLVSLTRCISSAECKRRYFTHRVQSRRMPSWVPNWADLADGEQVKSGNLVWIEYSDSGAAPALGFPRNYRASKDLPLRHWTITGSSIFLRAIHVAVVRTVWSYLADNNSDTQCGSDREAPTRSTTSLSTQALLPEDKIRQCWHAATNISAPSATTEDITRSFVRTMTADQAQLGGIDPEQMYRDGAAYVLKMLGEPVTHHIRKRPGVRAEMRSALISWERCLCGLGAKRALDRKQVIGLNEMHSSLAALAEGGNPEAFFGIARVFLMKRAFFVTKCGKLGLGPEAMQEGDLVYIIPGGNVPYIVSRRHPDGVAVSNSSLTFVGESWIDGFMAGEAIEALKGGEHDEVIELH